MNRLFSKSEIKALKDSIKKQKNSYVYRSIESTIKEEKVQELNNLYNAVLGIERNMKNSKSEKTLE